MGLAKPGPEKIWDERPRKVLVIGDDTRSFLATVRSLAKRHIEVHAAPFDFRAPALKSRYVARICYLPYYLGDGTEWLAAVEELFRRERYDLVIPCDERALLPLHHHRDRLAKMCRLAIPNERAMAVFFDKYATRELARSLGIPVARGRLIARTDTVGSIIGEAGLPLAVKPLQSYAMGALHARGKVAIVNNEASLSRILPSVRDGNHLFEAYLPGDGVGVSVLASRGKILQAFQHRRVHEWNGNGYYRVSAPLSPPLVEATGKIIAATDYTGVAMFEFKVNREVGRLDPAGSQCPSLGFDAPAGGRGRGFSLFLVPAAGGQCRNAFPRLSHRRVRPQLRSRLPATRLSPPGVARPSGRSTAAAAAANAITQWPALTRSAR